MCASNLFNLYLELKEQSNSNINKGSVTAKISKKESLLDKISFTNYTKIANISNNHKLEEISYKNKDFKYNFAIPKPSILPLSRTAKNINISKYENRRESNSNSNNNSNSNYSNINRGGYSNNKNTRNDNSKSNKYINYNECENKKGRNVKVIRTQKNGPSIIEKRFIAHSCEKCNNYLNFKKNSIRDNFHETHFIKKNDNHDIY